jgi:hypothetical protein
MSLLADVLDTLRKADVHHALIGAAALAVHGVSRSTADVDVLTMDGSVLRDEMWAGVRGSGRTVQVIRGDADDPLAGTVRLCQGDEVVDVVVGRGGWQREIVEKAVTRVFGDVEVPVASAAGIALLKLHAGGPKDAWDIQSLLEAVDDPQSLRAEVEAGLSRLGAECRRLWQRIAGSA